MNRMVKLIFMLLALLGAFFWVVPAIAQTPVKTKLTISVCGDAVVTTPEQCDVIGETGAYSTTIDGRQCSTTCQWGPYCGDSIMQTLQSETCDDGNNTSGDFCAADCHAESIPPGTGQASGGGSSSSGPFRPGGFAPVGDTQVSINGKAYPNSDVNILKDGKTIGVVKANAAADFLFTATGVTPGTSTFGFWAQDSKGLRSIAFTTTLQVVQGVVTTISGVFLPPTIGVDKKVVNPGGTIVISGQSVPEAAVTTVVNSDNEIITASRSAKDGTWSIPVDVSSLEEDAHTARAYITLPAAGSVIQSGFSQAVAFFVGTKKDGGGETGDSDLNGDGKVNLVDFSILIFNWGNPKDSKTDLNNDSTVNLTDFSILLFNWTG